MIADLRTVSTMEAIFNTNTHSSPAEKNGLIVPAGKPDVALQIQIFRDDQPVFTAPLSKLRADDGADFTRLPYMAELSLSTFPPGRYVLQITAIDRSAKTSSSQRARFVVE